MEPVAPPPSTRPSTGGSPGRRWGRWLCGIAVLVAVGVIGLRVTAGGREVDRQRELLVASVSRPVSKAAATASSGKVAQGVRKPGMSVPVMQQALLAAGFDPGPIDGKFGGRTVSALKAFQSKHRLPATGRLDARTMDALREAASGKAAARTAGQASSASARQAGSTSADFGTSPAAAGSASSQASGSVSGERSGTSGEARGAGAAGDAMSVKAVQEAEEAARAAVMEYRLRDPARIKQVQLALRAAGFEPGRPDGVLGARTKSALKAFQKSQGLPPDGVIGVKTWTALRPYLESQRSASTSTRTGR